MNKKKDKKNCIKKQLQPKKRHRKEEIKYFQCLNKECKKMSQLRWNFMMKLKKNLGK